MFFLIESEAEKLSLDNQILLSLIQEEKYLHTYKIIQNEDYFCKDQNNKKVLKQKEDFPIEFKDAIPLGTIEFTENYFKIFYGIEKENPIEIPPILRTEEFLKRKYSITSYDKIPSKGQYFIKDVSKLKVFSYNGDMRFFVQTDEKYKSKYSLTLNPTHLYQVSEHVNILSEYRVFVLDNEIYSINNYDGDVCLFPDVQLIKKVIRLWATQKDCPNSYSLDVAITPLGTIILECHILFSTGIYSTVNGPKLLYGYRDAKEYLLKYNTPIQTFSNFEVKD